MLELDVGVVRRDPLHDSRQSRDVARMFALSTEVTCRACRARARTRAARCRSIWSGRYSIVSKTVPSARTPARAVVEAADELADDEEVDALSAGRAQVRVDVELARRPDQAVLGRTVGAVELRRADRRPWSTASAARQAASVSGRQRVAFRPDRRAAEEVLLELELERQLAENACGGSATSGPMPSPGRSAIFTAPRG